jgi:pyruvate dehydrogenase (quinone)
MGALLRAGKPQFVQARHEETAAFMAVGHAKYTGGVGVCLSTQGPGAVHLLNGLYDAKLDSRPVVAIVGQQVSTVLGSAYQQEIDLVRLFGGVCAQFVQAAHTPEQVPMLLDKAFRTALATRSLSCVVVPHDVQTAAAPDLAAHTHGVMITAPGLRPSRVAPHDEDAPAAAEMLARGERVAVLVGQGAYGAAAEVTGSRVRSTPRTDSRAGVMPNVQQPEMRRSGKDPLVQDSATNIAEQQNGGGKSERHGKVPPDQQSNYGPSQDEAGSDR